jgi:hypothetical protein
VGDAPQCTVSYDDCRHDVPAPQRMSCGQRPVLLVGRAGLFFVQARAMAGAERSVSAANVSVPFVHPPVGSVGEPTTNRFS